MSGLFAPSIRSTPLSCSSSFPASASIACRSRPRTASSTARTEVSTNFRQAHPGKSIHRIAEGDDAPCCRPGLVGVCGTRFDSAREPESPAAASNVAAPGRDDILRLVSADQSRRHGHHVAARRRRECRECSRVAAERPPVRAPARFHIHLLQPRTRKVTRLARRGAILGATALGARAGLAACSSGCSEWRT